jgi:hypothetical protein
MVYRVDAGHISADRQLIANSGLQGSREVLIPDLQENEFDLLFADNLRDRMFRMLVVDKAIGENRTSSSAVLAMLEERCVR